MAKNRKKVNNGKNGEEKNLDKVGILADFLPLVQEGVIVQDCGNDGIKIENFAEGVGAAGSWIVDKEGRCHESDRVYSETRGYQLYSSNGKDFYLRPVKKP